MILYCAADPNYFNHYFDLWQSQCQKYYPIMRKMIAIYNPTQSIIKKCEDNNIEWKEVHLPENPERRHFYLLRWYNLPYEENDLILETQINCLPVATQNFNGDNDGVEHLRIARDKGNRIGGVSAAVFTPEGAKKVVEQAKVMFDDPPDDDHPMNLWQEQNLTHKQIVTEQQFKTPRQSYRDNICWITAGTSKKFTVEQKLQLLNQYKR